MPVQWEISLNQKNLANPALSARKRAAIMSINLGAKFCNHHIAIHGQTKMPIKRAMKPQDGREGLGW